MPTRVSKQHKNSIKIECVKRPNSQPVYDDLANFSKHSKAVGQSMPEFKLVEILTSVHGGVCKPLCISQIFEAGILRFLSLAKKV